MNFYQKYELLEPLSSGEIKRFRGREMAANRAVVVHLMVAGRTPENEALLARPGGPPGDRAGARGGERR